MLGRPFAGQAHARPFTVRAIGIIPMRPATASLGRSSLNTCTAIRATPATIHGLINGCTDSRVYSALRCKSTSIAVADDG